MGADSCLFQAQSGRDLLVRHVGQDQAKYLDLTAGQQAAIVALGATGAGVPASNQDHAHTDVIPEVPLSSTDERVFELQWKAAQLSLIHI